jgi:hypothetical protein
LWQVHQVTPTGPRLLAPPKPVPPPARPASSDDAAFAHAVRTAQAGPTSHQADVIDVEVLWEDGEEGYTPPVSQPRARSSYRGQAAQLRLYEPGAAIAAYRSAASTADLPHQTIDLFA